jgi:hypothetical protein
MTPPRKTGPRLPRVAILFSGGGAIVKNFGGPLDQFVSGNFDGRGPRPPRYHAY